MHANAFAFVCVLGVCSTNLFHHAIGHDGIVTAEKRSEKVHDEEKNK